MIGNIYWRPNRPGTAELKVYAGRDRATGKDRYKTKVVHVTTRRQAELELARFVTEVKSRGESYASGTLGALLDEYLQALEDADRSPTTLYGYESIVRSIKAHMGGRQLGDLRPKHLDDYYAVVKRRNGNTAKTAQNHHRFLSAALKRAVLWDYIDANPADKTMTIQVDRIPIDPPETEAVVALIDAGMTSHNPDLGVAELLLAATGGRRGEVCGVRRSDLRGNKLHLVRSIPDVPGKPLTPKTIKNRQRRYVTLDPQTLQVIRDHIKQCEERARFVGASLRLDAYILCDQRTDAGADGSVPWRPKRLTQAHGRLRTRVGTDARLHDLRHHAASVLADAGEGIPAIAARLGQDPEVTARHYAHLIGDAQERAAAIIGDRLARRAG